MCVYSRTGTIWYQLDDEGAACRAAAKQLTAAMDSDVQDLIEDENYHATPTVESAVWDSLDDRSCSYLWGLKAIIMRSLEDPDIDSKGMHKDGQMVPLVLEVQ